MTIQLFKNNVDSTIQGGSLPSGNTSLTVATGQGSRFPAPAAGEFFLATLFEFNVSGVEISHEVVKCTGRTADTFTVVRDYENMTGSAGGYAYPTGANVSGVIYIEVRWTADAAARAVASSLTPTAVLTGAYNVYSNELARVNSAGGSFTVTLPASPTDGYRVGIHDVTKSCGTNPVLVAANGKTVEGDATGLSVNINGAYCELVYSSSSGNWTITETPLIAPQTFPLTADVSGGGYFIDNVKIGNATPAAGKFTTLGSSGVTTINLNSGALPAGPTGTTVQIGQADATVTTLDIDAFGAAPQLFFRRAQGTNASKTAVTAGVGLGTIGGFGYGATGYSANSKARVIFNATETWTDSAQGASVGIQATANGGTTVSTVATFDSTGIQAAIGATTPSTGAFTTLSASGDITNTAATGYLRFSGTAAAITANSGNLYLDSGAAKSITMRPNGASTVGVFSSTGLAVTGDISVSTKTPASAAAAGVAGTITWDANYIYVCTATNTWKRVAIATW